MAAKTGRVAKKKSVYEQLKEKKFEEPLDDLGIDGKMLARELSAAAMERILLESLKEGKTLEDEDAYDEMRFQAKMVAATVVDGRGKPVFTEEEAAALKELQKSAFERISLAVTRVNSPGEESAGNV